MKYTLNENLFKVTYEDKEEYVITDNSCLLNINDFVFQQNYEKTNKQIIHLKTDFQTKIANDKNGSFIKLKIIASTFPLGGLPQFVINKTEELSDKYAEEYCIINNLNKTDMIHSYSRGNEYKTPVSIFKDGYNKHAEKYKFTEEDMINLYEGLLQNVGTCVKQSDLPTATEYLSSLQQPKEIQEIEFETEDYEVVGERDSDGYPLWSKKLKITKTSDFHNGLLIIKNIKQC